MIRHLLPQVRHGTIGVLLATMIIASYSISLVKEMDQSEQYPDYYNNILPMKLKCGYDIDTRGFAKYWSNCFSYQYIGNDKIIPVASSISCVYLVYAIASAMTKDRLIGIISMGIMSYNPLLTAFDSSATYDQLWAALFLFSILMLYKKSSIVMLSFPLAIASKIIACAYTPGMIIHMMMDNDIKGKKIIITMFGLSIIFGVGIVFYLGIGSAIGFYPERALDGFLRIFESIWPVFPLLIGTIITDRFFMPKETCKAKKIVIMWMGLMLIITPLIYIFTEAQLQFGYRFVPFAAFLSIYGGIVIVQLGNFIVETKLKKQSLKKISTT